MTTTNVSTSSEKVGSSSVWVPPHLRPKKTRDQLFREAFPKIDPGITVAGQRILVQLRMPKRESDGGILVPDDSKETEKDVMQIGVVVQVSPHAYKNRATGEPWPEGAWVKVGDFIRVPRYGGDRLAVEVEGLQDRVVFLTLNDFEVLSTITSGDPLTMKAYI